MSKHEWFPPPQGSDPLIRDGEVHCAHCFGHMLHHVAVRVWERTEDAEEGLFVEVVGHRRSDLRTTSHLPPHNPSGRRGGLHVELECEGCGRLTFLLLAQHKGETLVRVTADCQVFP